MQNAVLLAEPEPTTRGFLERHSGLCPWRCAYHDVAICDDPHKPIAFDERNRSHIVGFHHLGDLVQRRLRRHEHNFMPALADVKVPDWRVPGTTRRVWPR